MPATNLIVFRDSGREISGNDFATTVRNAVTNGLRSQAATDFLDALILAGQLESALSDCVSQSSKSAEALTNVLAEKVIGARTDESEIHRQVLSLENASMPLQLRISPAEGFLYYALHPADFADATLAQFSEAVVAIIGIRSIGTVLSAVALAALSARRKGSDRITVRPAGHPYNRTLEFNEAQQSWVEGHRRDGVPFLIVDEGPGLSGSSFLATAEALIALGVNQNQITLMGTRDVDPGQLCARDAARRWSQFEYRRVPSRICREFGHWTSLSGGNWRKRLFSDASEWPPCWPEMERVKFLSADRKCLLKFDGLGGPGAQVHQRSCAVHEAGFGPRCEPAGNGMSRYQWVNGRPLKASDSSSAVLERIAAYCAFRVSEFASQSQSRNSLEEATRFNFGQEFDRELVLANGSLDTQFPIIVDARMQPHEWLATTDGSLQKTDAATHGDDHFMPGPSDIAWDLAGTAVEWSLDPDATDFLLSSFWAQTGLDLRERFPSFRLAYAVFRSSYCRMAASGTQSPEERLRLLQAHAYYRGQISEACHALKTCPI